MKRLERAYSAEESPPTIKGHSHKRVLETEGNHSETRPLHLRVKLAKAPVKELRTADVYAEWMKR